METTQNYATGITLLLALALIVNLSFFIFNQNARLEVTYVNELQNPQCIENIDVVRR